MEEDELTEEMPERNFQENFALNKIAKEFQHKIEKGEDITISEQTDFYERFEKACISNSLIDAGILKELKHVRSALFQMLTI